MYICIYIYIYIHIYIAVHSRGRVDRASWHTLTRTSIHHKHDSPWGLGAIPSEMRLTASMPWGGIVFMMNARRNEIFDRGFMTTCPRTNRLFKGMRETGHIQLAVWACALLASVDWRDWLAGGGGARRGGSYCRFTSLVSINVTTCLLWYYQWISFCGVNFIEQSLQIIIVSIWVSYGNRMITRPALSYGDRMIT